METNLKRLILKKGDVLLVRIPAKYFNNTQAVKLLYTQIKKRLHPRKNKILLLPLDMEISVIGEEEIQEYITNFDVWELWDENGDKEM